MSRSVTISNERNKFLLRSYFHSCARKGINLHKYPRANYSLLFIQILDILTLLMEFDYDTVKIDRIRFANYRKPSISIARAGHKSETMHERRKKKWKRNVWSWITNVASAVLGVCKYINPCPKQSEVEVHFSSATLFGAKVMLHFTEQRRYGSVCRNSCG